jgi:Ala-tRNA(Pro) deacylase
MPVHKVKSFVDSNQVKYVTISHSPAYTAQDVAASAHIPGRELAKTVMVKLDGNMGMAVLPASCQIDLERLQDVTGAAEVELAAEDEFGSLFPNCDVGAMPPFGNLYKMEVFADEQLADDDEIAFCAGSHAELVQLAWDDFDRLVEPQIASFAMAPMGV